MKKGVEILINNKKLSINSEIGQLSVIMDCCVAWWFEWFWWLMSDADDGVVNLYLMDVAIKVDLMCSWMRKQAFL